MNTSQTDPILNQPSSTNSLHHLPAPANAVAEDPAPTPTRFLAECGRFTGTPIISGYSEVNPFEASFAVPSRQTGPVTSTPNLAVATVKKEFVKSLKANPVVDEHFSGLHLLADESISTPPLPVVAASSSWSAPSNNSISTNPPLNNASESTLQFSSVSRLETVGNAYAPKPHSHQMPAFTAAYDPRAVDMSVQATSTFPSSLSSSTLAHRAYKYEYASLPAAMARSNDHNNHVTPYGYSHPTRVPNAGTAYNFQSTPSVHYQNGEESLSSASPVQSRKREISMASGDKWNPQYASRSIDRREQKSRSESHDSSENRNSLSRTYRDEEGSNASNDEETPEEKRQRFLKRNRVAASKCRQKKKQWAQELEQKADEITITNKNLQNLVGQLKEEVMGLKTQLLAHRNCDCNVIQHYVQSSGQFGGTGTFHLNLNSGLSKLYGGTGMLDSPRDAMYNNRTVV